jgi:5-methylcytosine-specific restriction endonuclease McrA
VTHSALAETDDIVSVSRATSYRVRDGHLEHQCSGCRQWLPANRATFVTARSQRFGLGSLCLPCNRERIQAWRKQNPAKANASADRRHARERALPGRFTRADRAQLMETFGHRCVSCGIHTSVSKLVADHVVPTIDEGSNNDISNRQPLCTGCDKSKGTRTIDFRPAALDTSRRAA